MAKSKKTRKKQDAAAEPTPSFEESLQELQQIINDLEDGALGLEESMRRFETGVTLLRTCYQILERAEQKIEVLTGLDREGNVITTAFDASASFDQASQQAGKRRSRPAAEESGDEHDDDGDGTLF